MKKLWLVYALIGIIFCINFLYMYQLGNFSRELTSLADTAYTLADKDYTACGKYIDKLSEKMEKESLILYAFENREKIENIESSIESALEYYKLKDKTNLKHELAMIGHKINGLEKNESFDLKNIIYKNKLNLRFSLTCLHILLCFLIPLQEHTR